MNSVLDLEACLDDLLQKGAICHCIDACCVERQFAMQLCLFTVIL